MAFKGLTNGGWSKFILEGQGPSPGQKFKDPCGLTFHNDRLLVCDKDNNIVQILNQDYTCGKVLGSFSGQFAKPFKPQSVAVSKDNHYFILDVNNKQIIVCDQNNKVIRIITLPANINPYCIALLKGFVLVTDVKGHRLLKYTVTGQYIAEVNDQVGGKRPFSYPYFVAVNSKDVIMVSDHFNHCIKCFDTDLNYLYKYGHRGTGDSQLYHPGSIAVDGADHVYVCDHGNDRITIWSRDGTWIGHLFHRQMSCPYFMAVTTDGDRIAVNGPSTNEIYVFSK
ncbi:tripartite motif-containing protein 2-like [Ptychodera flava]|uniref:tripartite motif-containing protein 2-like n=1 Tax=Ptychodera flava TaxID=63121 RepID=UPI003969C15A